jgi:hypothetical protein
MRDNPSLARRGGRGYMSGQEEFGMEGWIAAGAFGVFVLIFLVLNLIEFGRLD